MHARSGVKQLVQSPDESLGTSPSDSFSLPFPGTSNYWVVAPPVSRWKACMGTRLLVSFPDRRPLEAVNQIWRIYVRRITERAKYDAITRPVL